MTSARKVLQADEAYEGIEISNGPEYRPQIFSTDNGGSHGRLPVSISNTTTPSDHQSQAEPYSVPEYRKTSGAA